MLHWPTTTLPRKPGSPPQRIADFSGNSSDFAGWLFGIARNVVLNRDDFGLAWGQVGE